VCLQKWPSATAYAGRPLFCGPLCVRRSGPVLHAFKISVSKVEGRKIMRRLINNIILLIVHSYLILVSTVSCYLLAVCIDG